LTNFFRETTAVKKQTRKIMKISDSLGNLYTHTMFKKKAYEMPAMAKNQNQEDSDEITGFEFVS